MWGNPMFAASGVGKKTARRDRASHELMVGGRGLEPLTPSGVVIKKTSPKFRWFRGDNCASYGLGS
jgi:hypothetical protein